MTGEAWAGTRKFGDGAPIQRRDKYGRLVGKEDPNPLAKRAVLPDHELVNGDVTLQKKITTTGKASRGKPSADATVTIHYVGTLPDGKGGWRKFASSREVVELPEQSLTMRESQPTVASGPISFKVGDGSVVAAWDLTVRTMHVGEKCELIAAPHHAYGENGAEHLGVPANMPVKFELELVEWKQSIAKREDMSAEERLAEATSLKARGTEAFKAGQLSTAMELYDNGAYYVADAFLASAYLQDLAPRHLLGGNEDAPPPLRPDQLFEGQRDEAQALLVSCLLNAAQMAIKRKKWRDAEERCSKVLQLDKKNAKALFRRGTARTRLGDYSDARADLRKACEIEPKSKEIREMFDQCNMAEADYKAEQRAIYAKMEARHHPPIASQSARLRRCRHALRTASLLSAAQRRQASIALLPTPTASACAPSLPLTRSPPVTPPSQTSAPQVADGGYEAPPPEEKEKQFVC